MNPKLKAFLNLIAWSEGTSTSPLTRNDGYDVIVTGINGPAVFTEYGDHPFANGGSVVVRENPRLVSTAAGRYQLLARYWNIYRVQLEIPAFTPIAQDGVALQQMKERGVTDIDDVGAAIHACANIWASLPGNNYGQGGHSIDTLISKYQEFLHA